VANRKAPDLDACATGVPSQVIRASEAALLPFTCTAPFSILRDEIVSAKTRGAGNRNGDEEEKQPHGDMVHGLTSGMAS